MSLKYCYNKEIHKTFTPPPTFKELLDDIRNVFETTLPKKFSVQYKDNDQDLITISSDVEYKAMLKFDAPNASTSIKIFIVPNNSVEEKELSFEVIDSSQLSANGGGISEISLSQEQSEHASSRENSPSPKQKRGSSSFQGFETSDCGMRDQKIQVSNVEPYLNQTFSQLYEAEALILQGLQAEPAEKNECSQVNNDEEEEQKQSEMVNQVMASEPDIDDHYLYTEMQGNARSLENIIFTNEIDKVTQELAARNPPKMMEKLRTPNNYQDSLLNQFLFPHENFQNMQQNTSQANNMSFDRQTQPNDVREMNITSRTQDKFYGNTDDSNDCNRYSRLLNHKRKLWSEELEEINRDMVDDFYPNFTKYAEQPTSPKQRDWPKFPTQRKIVNCDNYQKPKSPPRYLPPIAQQTRAEGYRSRYISDLPPLGNPVPSQTLDDFYFDRQPEPVKMMENQGYEVTPGLSSRLFSIEDSEGMRVVYKTVFIKNTGTKPWTRCFVKPVGLIAGKTVELCNVGVGQTAVVALELRGYFGSRTYTSRWKLVHENQFGMVEVIGGPFDVEFTINSNSVANDRVRMNMCEQSFEEDGVRFDYGRQDDIMQDGYKYEDFEDAENNREEEEDQEVDQTFARYFRPEEQEEDYDNSVHWFSYQDLRVKDFTGNVHETSIDEYYLN